MALDIFFAEDIRNALVAADEASAQMAAVIAEVRGGPSPPRQAQDLGQAPTDSTELLAVILRAYREGYKAALVVIALAFGIAPQAVMPSDERGALKARLGLEREDVEIEA